MASISMGTWTGIYDWSLIHERAVRQMIRFECLAASLQSKINCNMLQEWLLARKRARGKGRQTERQLNQQTDNAARDSATLRSRTSPSCRQKRQSTREKEREREAENEVVWSRADRKATRKCIRSADKAEAKRSEAHLSNLYGNVSIINGVDCFAANVWRIGIETRDIWRIYKNIHRVPSILCVTEGHTVRLKLRVQISFSRNSTMGK